jgi:hypothetical protein
MQNCRFCGSPLPDNVRFCGYCGGVINDPQQGTMDVTSPSVGRDLTLNPPPPPSKPPHSSLENAETEQQNTDVIMRGWPEGGLGQNIQQSNEHQSDDSYPVLPDIMLPGMFRGEGQTPLTGHVPMVHGTPQVGEVPTVQGTPSMPTTSPPGLAHGEGFSAPSPSSTPAWEAQIETRPVTQSPPPHYSPQTPLPHHEIQPPLHHPPLPQQHPQSMPNPPAHAEHQPHIHRPQPLRLRAVTSKLPVGAIRWIILLITVIVALTASGIIIALAVPPAVSLSGSSTVTAGGTLSVHGKGFFPGGSVIFTLDSGLPISLTNHAPIETTPYSADRGANWASIWQILLVEQPVLQATSKSTVSVSTLGSFDTTITVSTNWAQGTHTLHATEGFGSRSAALSFMVIVPPKLIIQQQQKLTASSNNCLVIAGSGNLIRGWLCTVTINTDSGDLSWTASSTNPSDQFTPSEGIVHPNHSEAVTIFIPNEPRCSNATFTFVGPINTISVSWSCPTH